MQKEVIAGDEYISISGTCGDCDLFAKHHVCLRGTPCKAGTSLKKINNENKRRD